jgi:hypothetical protein
VCTVYCIGLWGDLLRDCDRDTTEHQKIKCKTTKDKLLVVNKYIDRNVRFNNILKSFCCFSKYKGISGKFFYFMNCSGIVLHTVQCECSYNFYTLNTQCLQRHKLHFP